MCVLICFVRVLLGVAYLTLVERKLLAYAQRRVGPCVVGVLGLGQPFADAIKLFSKEFVIPHRSNRWAFLFAPVFMLGVRLLFWVSSPVLGEGGVVMRWGILYVLCVSRAGVHGILIGGWASNRKYALLGAVRAMAQVVSYEVVMFFLAIIPVLLINGRGRFRVLAGNFSGVLLGLRLWPAFVIWVFCVTAETNRAPFDFAEGESELVSGFNVEYRSGGFAMVFMAEYARIIFMGVVSACIFLGCGLEKNLVVACVVCVEGVVLTCIIVWFRAAFPRYRYDLLIGTT